MSVGLLCMYACWHLTHPFNRLRLPSTVVEGEEWAVRSILAPPGPEPLPALPLFHPPSSTLIAKGTRRRHREREREWEGGRERERERERKIEGETRPTRVRAGPLRITNPQKPSRLRCCLTATAVATTLRTFTLTLRRFKAMYPY